MNWKIRWILFFDLSGAHNYHQKSQKLSRDLLIILQMLDHCQPPVSIFLTLPTGSVVPHNPSKKITGISK